MNNIQPVRPQDASSTPTSGTSNGLPNSQGLDNMFLQLLVAQLQNQSPLNPMDPTQFVGQLAQFSELREVTQIDQILQQAVPTKSGSGSGGGTPVVGHSTEAGTTGSIPDSMLSSAVAAAKAANPAPVSGASSELKHSIQGVF